MSDNDFTNNIKLLYSASEIANNVTRLAAAIARDHENHDNVMIVALLKGSFVFAADLVRALHVEGCHPEIDFMMLSSYGDNTESKGEVTIHHDIMSSVKDKHVIIVDDILESGNTLWTAQNLLQQKGAEAIHICTLLEKPGKISQGIDVKADYTGFSVDDLFVVGYGLDLAGRYRELPYIGVVENQDD